MRIASTVSASLLPAGSEREQPLLTKTEPSSMLQHSVLALLHADPEDSEDVMAESTVMGFVYVYAFSLYPVNPLLPF
jgi:polyribonucleotide 5'-hydroxyl-kinase